MQTLFFLNSFFEEELASEERSISDFLHKHPVYLSLHYLSCCLSGDQEGVLLAHPPEKEYFPRIRKLGLHPPRSVFLEEGGSEKFEIYSWGPSRCLAKWAKKRGHSYKIPDWDVVKKVNGKNFSFTLGPKLPGAELLRTKEELLSWYRSVQGPKVLKTVYGFSGRGHCILRKEGELETAVRFFEREKRHSECVVGEPWVERVFDFSTQWEISEGGAVRYLGATTCENSPRGIYRRSLAGPQSLLFKDRESFFAEHLVHAEKGLLEMARLGFFGNVGFDAMVYIHPSTGKQCLHPIVEINARKTMGWAALRLYQKLRSDGPTFFEYEPQKPSEESFLPFEAIPKEKNPIRLPGGLVMRKAPF